MAFDPDKYISELHHGVTVAVINHGTWWGLSRVNRNAFMDVIDRYPDFFSTAYHAHFVALVTVLYRLYEPRPKKDTYSFPSFLQLIRENNTLTPEQLAPLAEQCQSIAPLWKKVGILRNKAFGHRSIKLSVEEVFRQADVSPQMLGEMVELSKDLLNAISYAWNNNGYQFDDQAKHDLLQLLRDIQRWTQSSNS